jgi:hypothetical protein
MKDFKKLWKSPPVARRRVKVRFPVGAPTLMSPECARKCPAGILRTRESGPSVMLVETALYRPVSTTTPWLSSPGRLPPCRARHGSRIHRDVSDTGHVSPHVSWDPHYP